MNKSILLITLFITLPVKAEMSLPHGLNGYSVWYGYSYGSAMTLCSLVFGNQLSAKAARDNMNEFIAGLDPNHKIPAEAGFAAARNAQEFCNQLFD